MRVRLRPAYDEAQLAALYAIQHDHTRWIDHQLRVRLMTDMIELEVPFPRSIADLSAGDGAIAKYLQATGNGIELTLADLYPAYDLVGPIEKTIEKCPNVDLFICTETLEHLDDPDLMLRKVRDKTKRLAISTPDGETDPSNPEHYWGWDIEGVREMLQGAGFWPECCATFGMPDREVKYQFWIAR